MKPVLPSVMLFIIALSGSAEAQTPEERLNRTASAAARAGSIGPLCSPFYVVDQVRTREVAVALAADGIKRFGRVTFDEAMTSAMLQFQNEVRQEGAAVWCPRQREHYRRIGIRDLIGGNLP